METLVKPSSVETQAPQGVKISLKRPNPREAMTIVVRQAEGSPVKIELYKI